MLARAAFILKLNWGRSCFQAPSCDGGGSPGCGLEGALSSSPHRLFHRKLTTLQLLHQSRSKKSQGLQAGRSCSSATSFHHFSCIMIIRSKVSSHAKELQFSRSVMSGSLWPMDCSTPGLPVHHQLPEFTQTHVHWVGDAIQPSQEDWLYKGMNARRWKHKMMLDVYHTLICILCSHPHHHWHSPRKKKKSFITYAIYLFINSVIQKVFIW